MLRQMDRITVAGELRKADHVGRGDGLLQPLGHADLEVVKEQGAQRRQAGGGRCRHVDIVSPSPLRAERSNPALNASGPWIASSLAAPRNDVPSLVTTGLDPVVHAEPPHGLPDLRPLTRSETRLDRAYGFRTCRKGRQSGMTGRR